MFGKIFEFFTENITLEKVSVTLVAVTVAIDRAAAVVDKISTIINVVRATRKEKAEEIIADAIVSTSIKEGTNLDKPNDISKDRGNELLSKAANTALAMGIEAGVNVTKAIGGEARLEAATQSIFKRVKAALTPNK